MDNQSSGKSEKPEKHDIEMRVRQIENGTVIDHIEAGQALNVLRILRIDEQTKRVVSFVMNTPGSAGPKDIVKIEDRELKSDEVDKISLISPNAVINIIRGYRVVEKHKVALPDKIDGFLRCRNVNCITNANEPAQPRFVVEKRGDAPVLRCVYCDNLMSRKLTDNLI